MFDCPPPDPVFALFASLFPLGWLESARPADGIAVGPLLVERLRERARAGDAETRRFPEPWRERLREDGREASRQIAPAGPRPGMSPRGGVEVAPPLA